MINYYDELNNLQCYQEYFQGPCKEGQQLTTIENELEIPEPICVPKNCSENQIDYNSTCVDIVTCGDNEVMQFNQEKQITECIFEFAIRSSLEVAIECRTEEGYHLSPSGDCVLGMISHKKSLRTIFGHNHGIKNFIKKFNIFHKQNFNFCRFWFIFGIKLLILTQIYINND